MKKIKYLCLLLFYFFFTTLAWGKNYLDLKQGRWSFGGNILLNLTLTPGKNRVALDLSLEPEFSYFFADRVEGFVAAEIKIDLIKTESNLNKGTVTWGLTTGPRYYFTDTRFSAYLAASYGFQFENFRAESFSVKYKVTPGALYGLSPRTALNFAAPLTLHYTAHHYSKGIYFQPGLFGVKTIL